MSGVWPLILDASILLLLAATVFLGVRLSLQLNNFRNSRREMEGLVKDLAVHVAKAQQAIEALRASADKAGHDIQGRINEAQALADELQIISESGDNLAKRLEQMLEKGRRQPSLSANSGSNKKKAPFMIQDREELQPLAEEALRPDGTFSSDDDDIGLMADDNQLRSRAEQELYEALRKNRKEKASL